MGDQAGTGDLEPGIVASRATPLRRAADRLVATLSDPATAVPLLFIAAFIVRAAWLDTPPHTLIFDESYYVNAARTLLGWPIPEGAPYAGAAVGLDPNIEHPPLGKLVMAGSMLVLGDTGLGWRLPGLIAGMTALGAVYLIVRAAGETAWFATLAVGLLAFDNLTLVHGRIGTLDMLALAPILVAAWLALRERWALAGVAVALGMLVKLTAGFGGLALVLLLIVRLVGERRRDGRWNVADLRRGGALIAASAVVFVAGLWVLDSRFTTFASPVDHVRHMVSYGASLKEPDRREGACTGISSVPWQWPFNDCQITYLRVATTVSTQNGESVTVPSIDVRGALNPILAGAIPLAALFALWAAWRERSRVALWAVAWAAANYLPYVVLSLVNHRVMYIYYFLPVVPGLAIAVALLLVRSSLPRFVAWGFVGAFAVGFLAYFPFRQIP